MADERLARLPDHVTLKRDDVATLLFALDIVEQYAAGEAETAKVRRAVVLLTRKLWPELGDLLDDEGQPDDVVELMTGGLRSPEVARRLGLDGDDVYRLLFAGELDGGPGRDGLVYFNEASVAAYLERYGYGTLSSNDDSEPKPPRG